MSIRVIETVFSFLMIGGLCAPSRLAEENGMILSVKDVQAIAGDSIRVTFAIRNETSARYVLPQMDVRDLCSSLLNVYIFDSSKSSTVFPCTEILQLDGIILNDANSFVLRSHSCHIDSITFSARDASILSKHGEYKLKMSLLLSETNFSSTKGDVWKKDLDSTPFGFSY